MNLTIFALENRLHHIPCITSINFEKTNIHNLWSNHILKHKLIIVTISDPSIAHKIPTKFDGYPIKIKIQYS